jgi:hypothetical protein
MARPARALAPPDVGSSAAARQQLDRLLGSLSRRVLVLHDRRRPGSLARLDHLVVTKAAVWVVDARRCPGRLVLTATGRPGPHQGLQIGTEDRTHLVRGLDQQVALVRTALLAAHVDEVPVRGALCLVDAELAPPQRPIEVRGHLVTWPAELRIELLEDGPFDPDDRAALHGLLARSFAPARHRPLS